MKVEDYLQIKSDVNYVIVHNAVNEVLKGNSYARRELASFIPITADLGSPINRHLLKLYTKLMSDIFEFPNKQVAINELSDELAVEVYSIKELREIARGIQIRGRTKMDALALVKAIKEAVQ